MAQRQHRHDTLVGRVPLHLRVALFDSLVDGRGRGIRLHVFRFNDPCVFVGGCISSQTKQKVAKAPLEFQFTRNIKNLRLAQIRHQHQFHRFFVEVHHDPDCSPG